MKLNKKLITLICFGVFGGSAYAYECNGTYSIESKSLGYGYAHLRKAPTNDKLTVYANFGGKVMQGSGRCGDGWFRFSLSGSGTGEAFGGRYESGFNGYVLHNRANPNLTPLREAPLARNGKSSICSGLFPFSYGGRGGVLDVEWNNDGTIFGWIRSGKTNTRFTSYSNETCPIPNPPGWFRIAWQQNGRDILLSGPIKTAFDNRVAWQGRDNQGTTFAIMNQVWVNP